jgi:putative ABC transport system permease protein
MLKNHLKVALRYLVKQKGYSLINIVGLAIGLSCSILILLYVQDERSYDRFHEKADQIYRVVMERKYPEQTFVWAPNAPAVAQGLVNALPEVLAATRLRRPSATFVRHDQKSAGEERVLMANATFFDVFSIKLIQGDPQSALQQPNSIVITRATAAKYFGQKSPLGETLLLDNADGFFDKAGGFRVTGVAENMPANSHFHFDVLVPIASRPPEQPGNWLGWFYYYTYIVVREDASPAALQAKLPNLIAKHGGASFKALSSGSFDEYLKSGNGYRYILQPLTDIHLRSNLRNELAPSGSLTHIYVLTMIALLILAIAGINFMNLSAARSTARAKEVGVRKVLGSQRGQLVQQFLTESVVLCVFALLLAMVFVATFLPLFNSFTGKALTPDRLFSPGLMMLITAIVVGVGVLAGSYPAFVLSAFRVVAVLKGKLNVGSQNSVFRSGLVISQFAISLVLMVGTAVVYRQLDYMLSKELGFRRDGLIVLEEAQRLAERAPAFKQELLRHSSVRSVAFVHRPPGKMRGQITYIDREQPENRLDMAVIAADVDLLQTLEIELVSGRNFRNTDLTDTTRYVLLNETAIQRLGWSGDEAGKQLIQVGAKRVPVTVIGTVRDFHFQSLHQPIQPMAYALRSNALRYALVRFQSNDLAKVLDFAQSHWLAFVPERPLGYSFLDDDWQALYATEKRIQTLLIAFSALAILVACLGLFGLASFSASHRIKEIGIRKTLGASATSIAVLLSRDFARLVVLAFLVGAPVGYLVAQHWLEDFAYRIDVGPGTLLLMGGCALLIALFTVSSQSVKVALANPIAAIKYE